VIRQALAVVLPSRMDNLPNTCIEAMAEGKAVIGTRGTSFEQLIEDGVSGLLCDVDDPTALRASIERLLAEPGLTASLGEKARARIAQLSGAQPLQNLLDFYRHCCAGRGR
jgi:glycosyltransferase involved in cell wall biosynthesis